MPTIEDDLKNAVKALKEGGVILYPTDTIWGLGCDATNPEAVKKVFDLKQREDSKSMLVLVDSEAKVQRLVEEVPDIAWNLIELSEKPLTIIYNGAKNLAGNLIAEDGSIGIRVTNEYFSQKLCERFRLPIVSTSANISGEKSPGNFSDVSEKIKNSVDYIVSYRQEDKAVSKASSILKVEPNGVIKIIRE